MDDVGVPHGTPILGNLHILGGSSHLICEEGYNPSYKWIKRASFSHQVDGLDGEH